MPKADRGSQRHPTHLTYHIFTLTVRLMEANAYHTSHYELLLPNSHMYPAVPSTPDHSLHSPIHRPIQYQNLISIPEPKSNLPTPNHPATQRNAEISLKRTAKLSNFHLYQV
jgi:hypothetical protein